MAALNRRELAAVLAGLRALQDRFTPRPYSISELHDIATDGGDLEPLSGEEIDDLCERLNQ